MPLPLPHGMDRPDAARDDAMKDQVITLFGGGGFLGRYVAQELLRRGVRLRIAERDPRRALYLRPQAAIGQIQFLAADVTRPDTVARALAGADAVVNLVGTLAGDFDAVHVDGARNIAQAAAAAGATRMVQLSAIGADPASPSAYGRSKASGEAAVREALPGATILRPSVVFGREDAFINRFARMATNPILPVVAPNTRLQPVYVADVAQAVLAALESPKLHGGQTYALGGPDTLTMAALMRWIAQATGRRPRIVELPDAVGGLLASLPGVPITRDQWAMLGRDNVVPEGAFGLAALGVAPTPLAAVAGDWLVQYRRNGRFAKKALA